MELNDIIKLAPSIQFVVTGADLQEFAKVLLSESVKNQQKEEVKEKLYSAEEVAQKLRCAKSTLWRWEKSGYITPIRIGHRLYYKSGDLESLEK